MDHPRVITLPGSISSPEGHGKMGSPDAYDKSAGTLPSPGIAKLMVWTMLLGILRVLASAARRAANIVLLADVARVHRTQLQKRGLDLFNSLLDIF